MIAPNTKPSLVERARELRDYRRSIYDCAGDDVDQMLAEAAEALEAMRAALQVIVQIVPRKQLEKAMNLKGETPYDIARAALAKLDDAK